MISLIARLIFKILGWKIVGEFPPEKKYVIIAVPHTSNWDFPLGLTTRMAKKVRVHYVGKDSLFKGPFGFIFYWLGGYPVDRSKNTGFVDSIVKLYGEVDELRLNIAPEGTRKKAEKWKSGFWHIAKQANVPIMPIGLDYGNKEVKLMDLFHPGESYESDLPKLLELFKGIKGKIPEHGSY